MIKKTSIKLCFFVCIMFLSCNRNKNDLFFINDYEDLLFMATSTNVKAINKSSSKLLYDYEKESKNYTYKEFGKIYENDNYTVYVIFSEMKTPELSYSFSVRTFTKKDFKIIDDYCFAKYNNDDGIFCYGAINKNNIVTSICDHGGDGTTTKAKIDAFGNFINI